jgi:hypothetical protein
VRSRDQVGRMSELRGAPGDSDPMNDGDEPLADERPIAEEIADTISRFVAGGGSVEAAVNSIRRLGPPVEVVQEGRLIYERRVGQIRDLRDPSVLVDRARHLGYWYGGPSDDDVYWPALVRELSSALDGSAIESIGGSSSAIVGLMRPPGTQDINTRGLVLGHVQSGKTTNFMSVIAKAADVGYRLFIVLSGITDNLRSQTQVRLEENLVGDIAERWFLLTEHDHDFLAPGNAANLLGDSSQRLLAVVKKNPYRLRRLVRWLNSAPPEVLASCPILLIDDEADQASIDVGSNGRTSRINGLIRQVLTPPRAAYVAYTATPFANLLIDPSDDEDLYPRDFIVSLPRPAGYFGAEEIFGREALTPDEDEDVTDGLDVVNHIPPDDVAVLLPPRGRGQVDGWTTAVTPSLGRAIRWFVMATAARRQRGSGGRHSTMLIHTSMLSAAHFRTADAVADYLEDLSSAVEQRDEDLFASLASEWNAELVRVPASDFNLAPIDWNQIEARIPEVLGEMRIIVDNYLSQDRLSYASSGPDVTAIVIGGNTLSRGLTLEGLTCSYFIRAASAYDTLLQMGRWFGYRRGYEDLVRIWMTADLESWFFALATVEAEVRREILRYEEDPTLTPLDVPVRIRQHPAMAVTSAAKMRGAVTARISFGRAREQTILFDHRNADWLASNIDASRTLLGSAQAESHEIVLGSRRVFRDVSVAAIRSFFDSYEFHERAFRMRRDLLLGYLDEQTAQGFLTSWSVVVMAHPDDSNSTLDLGLSTSVNMIQRNRLDMPNIAHANIKSLVSTVDRIADLDVPRAEINGMLQGRLADARLAEFREDRLGKVGLLCLYPISRNSQPRVIVPPAGTRRRLALEAVDDVIGVGIFFPEAGGQVREYTYLAADLSSIEREPDDTDIDAIDLADEESDGGDIT